MTQIIRNEKRTIKLEWGVFEVYDMTTDSYVTTLVSGQLMINGKNTDEEYEISKTKTSLKLSRQFKFT